MSDIRSLLEEYSQITGRPMATISVEEYLSFKKFEVKNAVPVQSLDTETDKKTEEILCTENSTKSQSENIRPIQQRAEKKTETKKQEQKKDAVNDKEAILAMLRSIPG